MVEAFDSHSLLVDELLALDVLQYGQFITAAGEFADQKVVLDDLWDSPEYGSPLDQAARKVIGSLTIRSAILRPTHFVAIPDGATKFVNRVANNYREASVLPISKEITTHGAKTFRIVGDVSLEESARVVLVDDVYTTGHSLRAAAQLPELRDRVVGALVVWDRSDPQLPKELDFPLISVIQHHIRLRR